MECFGVLFDLYRGSDPIAQFYEPINMFFKCSVALVSGLVSTKGYDKYDRNAIPYIAIEFSLYLGMAISLTYIQPYRDVVLNVKESLGAWLSVVLYTLVLT